MKIRGVITLFITIFLCLPALAQKKVINEEAYAKWRRVDSYTLSPDGRFVTYKYSYMSNDSLNKAADKTYYLFDSKTKKTRTLADVSNLSFAVKGEWMVYEQHDKDNGDDSKLMLMRMKDGKLTEWNREDRISLNPTKAMGTYTVNKGKDFVIYNLNTGDTVAFEGVKRVNLFDNETSMIYIKENENSNDLYYGSVAKGAAHKLLFSDKSKTLSGYYFNEKIGTGSFEVAATRPEKDDDKQTDLMYNFDLGTGKTELVLDKTTITLNAPLYIDKSSFSKQAGKKYITFNVHPTEPEPRKKETRVKDTGFELELWSWNDPVAQSVQAISGYREQRPNPNIHLYNTQTKKHYPIVTSPYSSIYYSNDKDCNYAFFSDESPYSHAKDWEHDTRADLYLVDLRNGDKKMFKQRTTQRATWSHNGDYIVYYDCEAEAWISLEPQSFTQKNISASIGHPVASAHYDKPNPRPSYGISGWTSDGKNILINDARDIWVVDITGEKPARSFTGEYGRKNNCYVRMVNPNYSDIIVDLSKSYDLEICDLKTMDVAIGTLHPSGKITKHIQGPYMYKIIKQSDNSDTYLYQRQSYGSDRDLWISDATFKKPHKLTNANEQQQEYKWGRCEIVEWTNYEGKPNRGLLFLPEDYQKGKSYPAIVNFYETHTGERHIYHAPMYSSAMLDVATYVSNGYIIFMPDVHFTIGEPGKSSYNAVVSGTQSLIDAGVLDPERIGLQGHSWSGYQTSYLITKTNMFKCVNVGAPIVNMTSAYNGLREGSGMPRMFMYEDWQCRMGTTMWSALDKFIESSPILYADKINTPVLLFHCDKDEAVSFYEGRSLFLALRRLQKPAWMLNYKGEGHFVNKQPAQADWTRRMSQFFDYYLKNTDMPRWMSEGININERGFDQKFDFQKHNLN